MPETVQQNHQAGTLPRDEGSVQRAQLDLVLLGQIMACIHTWGVIGPKHKHTPSPRQKARMEYCHQGRSICRATFLMLHEVGKSMLVRYGEEITMFRL